MISASSKCWVARWAFWICSRKSIKALINNFHCSLHNSWHEGGGRGKRCRKSQPDSFTKKYNPKLLKCWLTRVRCYQMTSVWQNMASNLWWKSDCRIRNTDDLLQLLQITRGPRVIKGLYEKDFWLANWRAPLYKRFLSLSISVIVWDITARTWESVRWLTSDIPVQYESQFPYERRRKVGLVGWWCERLPVNYSHKDV